MESSWVKEVFLVKEVLYARLTVEVVMLPSYLRRSFRFSPLPEQLLRDCLPG